MLVVACFISFGDSFVKIGANFTGSYISFINFGRGFINVGACFIKKEKSCPFYV